MKVGTVNFFRRTQRAIDRNPYLEQSRKQSELDLYRQKIWLRHNCNVCMGYRPWSIYDVSMK